MKYIIILPLILIALIGVHNNSIAKYKEGDQLSFWSVSYIDWPPLQNAPQREFNAECKKAGSHCYIFVEVGITQPEQSKIDALVDKFDNYFYDSLTTRYGPVPDVFDNDSNIFILVMDDPYWGGYYDPANQMSDSLVYAKWNRHSNEREIIYIAASSFYGAEGIVAHEFGHLLHWQGDHSPEPIEDPIKFWEDAWVDEGFSTFAAIYLCENIFTENLLDYGAFFTYNPDIPLIYFSSYNQVKLFMLFMFEHYGGWDYIAKLISNQLNGIAGIESTLKSLGYSESFDDVFEHWIITNFLDDSIYESGKYSYKHYSFLYCLISDSCTSFPTETKNATLYPYAADYISFTSDIPNPIKIKFDGQTNSKFRLCFILRDTLTKQTDTIIIKTIDENNHCEFIAEGLGIDYNQVIMVVMNVDSSIPEGNKATYSYSADNYSGISDNFSNTTINIFPNPAKDMLYIMTYNDNSESQIEIINSLGIICYNETFINKTSIDINDFSTGIYIIKVSNKNLSYIKKVIKE